MEEPIIFEDRQDAGRRLADQLEQYRDQNPIVLGLPRGGVVVGYEIAQALEAPLDVIVARKLGAPMQPELGIGAVAPGGIMLIDESTIQALGLTENDIARVAAQERQEMERRLRRYRHEPGLPDVAGRTVILVDDGLATGVTAFAAIRAVRQGKPARIVLAVAVCALETAEAIRREVDDLVCVSVPERFRAVGLWYRQFEQNTDEQVIQLLDRARSSERTSGEG